ncbi:DNA internalization-related competence protein ComEC/Rec2 [Vreelandella gomseomensis]|uniref:DNA internalization-related competence protein ComEC/Rec2 n=1 Tax=Vreelandella gomseomensis TaxID=370766 RepID=A0ABU1GA82_9GAMM|nr:DNA internalization-related competence protein ComEC/Rec2 [Halomonas gomseomensis]MDR5873964.1 DNA internalization-related competence protein ComEC/Rec2 [Halomonas gomseomensis]
MRVGLAMPTALSVMAGGALGGWLGPGGNSLWLTTLLGMLLLAAVRGRYCLWWLMACWGLVAVQSQWANQLPLGLTGEDVRVEGRVAETQQVKDGMRLLLDVQRCEAPARRPACKGLERVRVSAYAFADVLPKPGERWQMTLRLRPPTGFMNPGTFDFAHWLWREGIHATGYVRQDPPSKRLTAAPFSLRQQAHAGLQDQPLAPRTKRWLAALTLGLGDQLVQDDWELLNASGTTHLVVISGLHVGLVASFVLLIARQAARWVSPGNWRLQAWPWWLSGVAALGYAVLAGMAPPAMRAMIMTVVGLWVMSGRHAPGPWQGWWLALAAVLMLDPVALWRPGLWLSFLAVAWLIIIWQGRPRPQGLRGWGWALLRSQLLLAPLMAAAVLIAFGRVAPAAPLINLIAVPFMSLVMVPLALLGWLLTPLPYASTAAWWLFEQGLEVFYTALEYAVVHWPQWEPPRYLHLPWALGLCVTALSWGLPGMAAWLRRGALVAVIVVPFWPASPRSAEGELIITVYDVGQGQLVELRSADYRMLVDTGPRYRSGFMPIETLWPPGQYFDRVMVSHGDSDHAGGVQALRDQHRVGEWRAPSSEPLAVASNACERGDRWQRDGVSYQVLWPNAEQAEASANDRSCVLAIDVGGQRVVITGDVGREVERRLVGDLDAPITALVAGHHGSASSSGPQFVRAADPRHVIFSAGRDNPFGHPSDTVVRRFREQGSCLWNTAQDGAVQLRLMPGAAPEIKTLRQVFKPRQRC